MVHVLDRAVLYLQPINIHLCMLSVAVIKLVAIHLYSIKPTEREKLFTKPN